MFKRNLYHRNIFYKMMWCFIAPFMIHTLYVDDPEGGGGDDGDEKEKALLEKINTRTAKQLKDSSELIKKDVLEVIDESNKGNITKEAFDEEIGKITGKLEAIGNEPLFKEIQETLKAQGVSITSLKEGSGGEKNEICLEDQIAKKMIENKDTISKFKNSDSKGVGLAFTVKGTVIRSDITSDTMAHRVPGVARAQRRKPYLRELFTPAGISPNNHGVIRYTDQTTDTNNAAAVAEAAAFPSSDIAWTEYNIPIEKIGDSIKVSRESADDIDYITSEINNFLLRNIALKVDTDLLSGNGATPNLKGMAASAGAFAAGNYALQIADAQLYDLITVIGAQIMTGTNFMPTGALLHPEDSVLMKLNKDADGNYLIPPFVVPTPDGDIIVDGMLVVVNSGVATNTMYVGDFSRGVVYSANEVQIEMGYENDDFTKDLVTVKGRERMCLLIRTIDAGAFKKVADIDTAISQILKP